jgi:cytochrome c oxidase subunit 2
MGKITGLVVIFIAIATVLMFVGQSLFFGDTIWWLPQDISEHGPEIDAQFSRTLWVVGIAFTAAQLALGYAIFRYARRGNERAVYTHGSSKLEATWTIITAAIFVGLAILGQQVWAQLHFNEAPAGATRVGVVAQQFKFTFHYPGADGVFGRTDPKFYNDGDGNFVGLAPTDMGATVPEGTRITQDDLDPNAADDVQVGTLVIPEGQPVELALRSRDVIHSFFIPVMRFKQDTVPGLVINVHFTAKKLGKYEIPCAELCGNQHSTMKGYLLVVPREEYDQLTRLAQAEFIKRINELEARYATPQT